MQSVSRKQWQNLYLLAEDIWKIRPWEWLKETDIFGISVLDFPQTAWISVLGNQGQHYAISIYLGHESLLRYWKFRQNPNPIYLELLQIPSLQLSFESWTELHPKDIKVIESLDLSTEQKAMCPVFRSYQFGHPPWFLEPHEAVYMLTILPHVHAFFSHIQPDAEKIYLDKDEHTLLNRQQVQTNGKRSWQSQPFYLNEQTLSEPDYFLSDFQLEKLRELPRANHTVQADILMLPSPVNSKDRPFFPFICILLDVDSGMVVGEKMIDPPGDRHSCLSSLLEHLVQEIINLKTSPENIIIRYPGMAEYLNQISELPFRTIFAAEMSEMRDFYEHMIEFMTRSPSR